MTIFKICDGEIDKNENKYIVCIICQCSFHAHYSNDDSTKNCAAVNASEFKLIEMKRKQCLFVYRCVSCTEKDDMVISRLDNFISDLNKIIVQMDTYKDNLQLLPELCAGIKLLNSERIPRLEDNMNNVCNSVIKIQTETIPNLELKLDNHISETNNNTQNLEDNVANAVIREINERNYKEKIVIVYNIPDNNNLKEDKKTFLSLIPNTDQDFSYVKVSRIGSFLKGKNRPIRIATNNTDHVSFILSNNEEIGKKAFKKFLIYLLILKIRQKFLCIVVMIKLRWNLSYIKKLKMNYLIVKARVKVIFASNISTDFQKLLKFNQVNLLLKKTRFELHSILSEY